jgi:hypothetical protein
MFLFELYPGIYKRLVRFVELILGDLRRGGIGIVIEILEAGFGKCRSKPIVITGRQRIEFVVVSASTSDS